MEKNNEGNNTFLFRRIIAGAIDYLIVFIIFFTLLHFFGVPSRNGGSKLSGFPALFMILCWLFVTAGMEYFFGSTTGNSISGLTPISLNPDSEKIKFTQSLKRHLLDVIDMSLFGLIGILLILNTEKNQRLGDIWAKTKVIRTR